MSYIAHLLWGVNVLNLFIPSNFKYLKITAFTFFLIALSCIAGLHKGGVDIDEYMTFYENYTHFSMISFFGYPEVGFQSLMVISNSLGLSFEFFIFFLCLLSFYIISIFCKKLGFNQIYFYLLYIPKYFFQGHINQVRSSLIYPFVLGSVYFLEQKKYFSVIAIGLMLSLIHSSAVLLCFTPLLLQFNLTYISLGLLFFIPILLSPFIITILESIYGFTAIRQLAYLSSDFETVGLLSIEIIRRSFFIFLILIYIVVKKERSLKEDIILKFYVVSWFLYTIFIDIRVFSDRLGALFGVVEPLLIILLGEKLIKQKLLGKFFIFSYALLDFVSRYLVGAIPLFEININ